MKRISCVVIIAVLMILLVASCAKDEAATITATTTMAITEEITTRAPVVMIENDPTAILLEPEGSIEAKYDIPFKMQHRDVFYTIDGRFEDAFGKIPDGMVFFVGTGTPRVMALKTFIEHFNIPREEFDVVIEEMKRASISLTERHPDDDYLNVNNELREVPNSDIIYTFDDEIIDAYYRRENPIAPDWLGK